MFKFYNNIFILIKCPLALKQQSDKLLPDFSELHQTKPNTRSSPTQTVSDRLWTTEGSSFFRLFLVFKKLQMKKAK